MSILSKFNLAKRHRLGKLFEKKVLIIGFDEEARLHAIKLQNAGIDVTVSINHDDELEGLVSRYEIKSTFDFVSASKDKDIIMVMDRMNSNSSKWKEMLFALKEETVVGFLNNTSSDIPLGMSHLKIEPLMADKKGTLSASFHPYNASSVMCEVMISYFFALGVKSVRTKY